MKKMYIICFGLILSSCFNDTDSDSKPYVISEKKINESLVEKNGELQYGHFNFILHNDDSIIVHRRFSYSYFDDVLDESDELLPFLRLSTSDLEIVKANEIEGYIGEKLRDTIIITGRGKKATYVTIVSERDTILNKNFEKIKNQLIKQNIHNFYIRLLTEEENEVLKCFVNKVPFDSKKIRWVTKFKESIKPPAAI